MNKFCIISVLTSFNTYVLLNKSPISPTQFLKLKPAFSLLDFSFKDLIYILLYKYFSDKIFLITKYSSIISGIITISIMGLTTPIPKCLEIYAYQNYLSKD